MTRETSHSVLCVRAYDDTYGPGKPEWREQATTQIRFDLTDRCNWTIRLMPPLMYQSGLRVRSSSV